MAIKFVIFACALAVANAGYLGAPAAIAAPAVTYSAAPAVSHVSYASPVVSYGAAPAAVAVHSPALTSQSSNIVRSFGNLGQVATQSKTINTPFSSVYKSDVRVSNPGIQTLRAAPVAVGVAHAPVATYAAAPVAYAHAPVAAATYAAAAPVVKTGLLGVAYSPATAVSHMTYSAPAIGLQYAW